MDADKQPENRKRIIGKPFPKGVSGNPKGRPPGKTMKEFAREFLLNMTNEDKANWLKAIPSDTVWKMAEGNPHNTQDMKLGGEITVSGVDVAIRK